MVHVNDGTLNDEAIIPFGGMGDSGNGGRYGGEASLDTFTEWQWVTVRDEPADVPVLSGATSVASITDVARLAGVSTATVSRVVSAAPYAVSAATRARVLEAARTLDYVPNALARGLLKSHIPVVGGDRPRHHRPVLLRGGPRRRGRGDARRLPGHHLQLGPRSRSARTRTSACCARCARRRVIFAGSGLDDPVAQRGDAPSTSPRCAPTARPSSTSRRMPRASPRSASTTPAGIAAMVAALVALGPSPDRVPGRADRRSTSPASGWRAIAAAWPRRASPFDERLVVQHRVQPRRRGARRRHAPRRRRRRSPRSAAANDLLALGALRAAGRARHRRPGRGLRRGLRRHPDGRDGRAEASRPSGCRCTRSVVAGSRFAERLLAGGRAAPGGPADRARHARLDRAAAGIRAARGRGPPARRGRRLMAGSLAGRVVLVTGSSRGIGAEVAVKAAAEGASVAVHYHRVARAAAERDARAGPRRPAPTARPSPPTSPTAARPRRWSRAVIDRFGRVDGLVNNAGLTQVGPFLEIEPAEWDEVIAHRPDRRLPHVPGRAAVDGRARQRLASSTSPRASARWASPRPPPTARPRPG